MATSLVGQTLGKYELIDFIGEGGMASVYKGYDATIARHVAIKVLVTDSNLESNRARLLVERFKLEAKTIANVQHPHILSVHDYGIQDNMLFLVMPYLQDGTLKDRIVQGKPVALAEISRILNQIASALDYAHRQDIIHRDIKPSNILVDGEGNILLADFGLVKIVTGDSDLTESGMVIGTPSYMAPEYGNGMAMTARSDIYALGITIFEMVTGRPPYGDTTTHSPVQIALQHMIEPVPIISELVDHVPPQLDAIFARVLAKDPADRYATAAEFAEAFQDAVQDSTKVTQSSIEVVFGSSTVRDEPTTVYPKSKPTTNKPDSTSITIPLPQRTGLITIAAAVVILLVLGGLVLVTLSNNSPLTTDGENPDQSVLVSEPDAAPTLFGQANFLTTGGLGDTLSLQVNGLRTAPGESRYYVWLTNTQDGTALNVGVLPLDAMGNGTLTYSHPEGVFLPAVFNSVIITAENDPAATPSDEVYYLGSIPETVTQALYTILLSSPAGIQERGLLSSAIAEAYIAREQNVVSDQPLSAGRTLTQAEHTVNTLLGGTNDYNGDGVAGNPGFGMGLPTLLDAIDQELAVIITAAQDSPQIASNAEYILACVANTRDRVQRISELEQGIVAAENADTMQAEITEITRTLDSLLAGYDQNANGRVEGYYGECGLNQIAAFTLLIGTMEIQEATLTSSQAVVYNTPYEFTPGRDMCLDTELEFGIEKAMDDHINDAPTS
jgi:serine/threonine protein kinase